MLRNSLVVHERLDRVGLRVVQRRVTHGLLYTSVLDLLILTRESDAIMRAFGGREKFAPLRVLGVTDTRLVLRVMDAM